MTMVAASLAPLQNSSMKGFMSPAAGYETSELVEMDLGSVTQLSL
jgi:hypothetical protein